MSLTVRELAAKLGLDVDAQSFAKGDAAIEIIKAGLGKLVDVASEAVHKFIEVVEGTAEAGDQIKELSQATGVGVESLQILANAAKSEGVGMDGLAHSLTILTRMMAAAKGGSKDTAAAFKQLGVEVSDGRGHIRNADEVFLDLAEAMSKMPDSAQKTALAFKVLGKSGPDMIKVLNMGREEIEEMGRAGLILTKEQIEAGDELVKTQRKLGAVTGGIWKTAIAPLLPEITALVKSYLAWRKANADVMKQRIRGFISGLIAVVKFLGTVFATTARVIGAVIQALQTNWQLVLVGMTAALAPFIVSMIAAGVAAAGTAAGIIVAWTAAAAPFILLAGIVGGLLGFFDDIITYNKAIAEGGTGINTVFGRYRQALNEWLKEKGDEPWWLRALKDFVRELRNAIEMLDEFNAKNIKAFAKDKALELLLAQGGPIPRKANGDIDWFAKKGENGEWQSSEVPPSSLPGMNYRADGPLPATAPRALVQQHNAPVLNFNGPTDQGTVDYAYERLDQWFAGKMEEAAAAQPATE
jgi:hypothetical protein